MLRGRISAPPTFRSSRLMKKTTLDGRDGQAKQYIINRMVLIFAMLPCWLDAYRSGAGRPLPIFAPTSAGRGRKPTPYHCDVPDWHGSAALAPERSVPRAAVAIERNRPKTYLTR